MAWTPIVGKSFQPDEFDAYVRGLVWNDWKPQFITLHNTAAPNLAQRPQGWTRQSIGWLEEWCRDSNGWQAGPHLFIDDKQIWAFTPLNKRGTHSPGFNATAIGIEMLGDYAKDEFTTGRGSLVRSNTVSAMASISNRLGFKSDAWKFHMEDPRTTHDCPGIKARRDRANLNRDIAIRMAQLKASPRSGTQTGTQPIADTSKKSNPWDKIAG